MSLVRFVKKELIMETLIVKIKEPSKTHALVEMLKSINFVSSVDYYDSILETRKLFDEVYQLAAKTDLSEMSMDDIDEEIKKYRVEKKLNCH